MAFSDDLYAEARKIFADKWEERDGTVVPETTNLALGNEGVNLSGTVLYADLDGSTAMVDSETRQFAGEVYKAYLRCCARVISLRGGTITAYDGDRVMAVFIGNYKNTNAAKCALNINYVVRDIINPAIRSVYTSQTFQVKQVVGVDTSKLMATRTGVRGNNDLVWVGRAANYAAKLTTLSEFPSWITKAVYDSINEEVKLSTDGRPMWQARQWKPMNNMEIYCSNWYWKP